MSFRKSTLIALLSLAACAGQQEETKPTPPPAPPPAPVAQQAPPPPAPDAFRNEQPKPLPMKPTFDAPVPEQRQLANGLTVLVVSNHALPLVSVDLMVKAGVDAEPRSKAGIADFVASTLDEGTKRRTTLQIAEALEDVAAHYSASADLDATHVHLNSLAETLPQALEVMADVVMHPAFRRADVERVRAMKRNDLLQKQGFPSALAYDEMAKQLYGEDHPWGQPAGGTLKTLASITPSNLARFHHRWFLPNNAVITFSGDITPDVAQQLAEKAFGAWRKGKVPELKLPPIPDNQRQIVVVPVPHASQSQVWTGTFIPVKATDPAAIPLKVANYPLGGLFTSRLNLNLREAHGYSYGVFSRVGYDPLGGTLVARGGIVAKDTAPAVVEYEKELTRFANGQITDEELTEAKNAYIRSLPSALETNDAVSFAVNGLVMQGLPLDYYRVLPDKVLAVTKEDVANVVTRFVKPKTWPFVVAGPGEVKADLEKLSLAPVVEDFPEGPAPLSVQEKGGNKPATPPVEGSVGAQKPAPHRGMMTKQKQAQMKQNPPPPGTKPTGKE